MEKNISDQLGGGQKEAKMKKKPSILAVLSVLKDNYWVWYIIWFSLAYEEHVWFFFHGKKNFLQIRGATKRV